MWWIIPLIGMGAGIGTLLFVGIRKIPELRVINVDTLPTEQTRKVKEAIIIQRFERNLSKKLQPVQKMARAGGTVLSRYGRRLVQRLYALEQSYQRHQANHLMGTSAMDAEAIRPLLQEANEWVQKGEYFEAEKRYIEIISHHPKYAKVYEALGNLYMKDKKYDQARETLQFALKIQPNDASIRVSLGELALQEGEAAAAAEQFKQAVNRRPHNPKYLDFYTEASIRAKQKFDAMRGLTLLRTVNPENQKIEEFERRIGEIE